MQSLELARRSCVWGEGSWRQVAVVPGLLGRAVQQLLSSVVTPEGRAIILKLPALPEFCQY